MQALTKPGFEVQIQSKKKPKQGWSFQGLGLNKNPGPPHSAIEIVGFLCMMSCAVSRLPAWRDRDCQNNMPRLNQETTVSRENSPPRLARGEVGVLWNSQGTGWEWHRHSSSSYGSTWSKLILRGELQCFETSFQCKRVRKRLDC